MNPANGNRENENVAGYRACENRTEREWQNGEKFNTVLPSRSLRENGPEESNVARVIPS